MKTLMVIAASCFLFLIQEADASTRVLRQTEWENFLPPFWRQDPEDEATQPAPLPQGNGSGGPVVDGSGSLLGCNCPVPPQFNPVCGSDGVTYGNLQKLNCARSCGKNVRLRFMGNCSNG
ncbi:uncharacterized protein LOC110839526 [Zootermopsis nevadensis]|uniref:Kazal-like domain-containing protein n=1 Tax=Zootermopsis nevadensis TaxID=136037 RepID=A0A067RRL2_ZOONE|nr:uncharacterized protein LOC110839526 [Zootermopsis nevadensis]KDR23280.1 hypothetical protein L798_15587 [Zootermopsis nevadensis]